MFAGINLNGGFVAAVLILWIFFLIVGALLSAPSPSWSLT